MPKVKMAVARERRMRVLAALRDRGADSCAVELSVRTLAEAAGLTYDQARSALRSLVAEGAVRALPRSLPNGGTAENAYVVVSGAPVAACAGGPAAGSRAGAGAPVEGETERTR